MPISIIALPPTSSDSRSTSGIKPYFAGAKNVECTPIMNSAPRSRLDTPGREAKACDRHDEDFEGFDRLQHHRLVVSVRELARHPREQNERQDEESIREIRQYGRIELCVRRRVIRRQNDEHILVDVVVECTEGLCPEKRQESALRQKLKLAAHCEPRRPYTARILASQHRTCITPLPGVPMGAHSGIGF